MPLASPSYMPNQGIDELVDMRGKPYSVAERMVSTG